MQTYVKIGKGLAKCTVGASVNDTEVLVVLDRLEKRTYEDADGRSVYGWTHVGALRMVVSKHRIVDDLPYGVKA